MYDTAYNAHAAIRPPIKYPREASTPNASRLRCSTATTRRTIPQTKPPTASTPAQTHKHTTSTGSEGATFFPPDVRFISCSRHCPHCRLSDGLTQVADNCQHFRPASHEKCTWPAGRRRGRMRDPCRKKCKFFFRSIPPVSEVHRPLVRYFRWRKVLRLAVTLAEAAEKGRVNY